MEPTLQRNSGERSLGELVSDATRESADLFRKEIELAKLEVVQAIGKLKSGVAGMAIAVPLLFAGLLTLVLAAVLAVDTALQSYVTARGMLEEFPATKELVTRADGRAWLTWPQGVAICARVTAPGEVPWIGLLDAPDGSGGILEVILPRAATLEGTLRVSSGSQRRRGLPLKTTWPVGFEPPEE